MRVSSLLESKLASVVSNGDNMLIVNEEFKNSLFDPKYSMVTYDELGQIEQGAHNNIESDNDLLISERELGHGTKIEEHVKLTNINTDSYETDLVKEELVTENINLLKGITVLLGALMSKKTFLSYHLDDIARGDGHYCRLPFLIKSKNLWADWYKIVNNVETAKSPNVIKSSTDGFTKYAAHLQLLERAADSTSSFETQMIAIMPWNDSDNALVDCIHPMDIFKLKTIANMAKVTNMLDLDFSNMLEINANIDVYSTNIKHDLENFLFNEELEKAILRRNSVQCFEGGTGFNSFDIFVKVNDINVVESFKDLIRDDFIQLSTICMLQMFQLATNNRLNIQINSERAEYQFSPDTMLVKLSLNMGPDTAKSQVVKVKFRGMKFDFEVNIIRFMFVCTFYGKLTVSSLNPHMINNGLRSSLASRAFDLTFLKQLIAFDLSLVEDSRRSIFEVRDDHSDPGEATQLFLAACTTVIGLKQEAKAEDDPLDFTQKAKAKGIKVILNEKYIRFKFMKTRDIDAAQAHENNVNHLKKVVYAIQKFTTKES